jgi:hypothetical protein
MRQVPLGYDPILLYQWLWFKYQCFTASSNGFQVLFERIMLKVDLDFMQVRPYGNIGDRKCDGLLFGKGTVYQVYSPDEMKQKETLDKINEDLAGAVEHWGNTLEKWVFVYNVIRGVPPDIPRCLKAKKAQYPNIEIEHLSSDGLWQLVRNLEPQIRVELLGAPPSYEYIFNPDLPDRLSADAQIGETQSWIVLIQDSLIPVDTDEVLSALKPNVPFGAPYFLRPESASWEESTKYQRHLITTLLEKCRQSVPPRFAIFSVTPIPYAVHLGFLLTESVQTKYFKLHKDTQLWHWLKEALPATGLEIKVVGLPNQQLAEQCDVVVRVSISAEIHPFETEEVIANAPVQIDMVVDKPHLLWLRSPIQVRQIGNTWRDLLADLRRYVPLCKAIHLFYAGPTAGAVIIGQQINPRMHPPVFVYNYSRQRTPRYELALILKEEVEI